MKDSWWQRTWDERGGVLRSVLGETCPPGKVIAFRWDDPELSLPGACAMQFANRRINGYTIVSCGLTQPVSEGDESAPWELSLHCQQPAVWAQEIIYDLVVEWVQCQGQLNEGDSWPLTFYSDKNGDIGAMLAEPTRAISPLGEVRRIYLWPDVVVKNNFAVSTGEFFLMNIIGVTADEDRLCDDATPPHLIYFLKRAGLSHQLNPLRKSVLNEPGALELWQQIRSISHDEVRDRIWNEF